MSKFEVLKYNKLFFKTDAFGSFVTWNVFINAGLLATSYCVFIFENSSELKSVLEAFLIFVGTCQAVGGYLFIRLNTGKINAFHTELQRIIDEGLTVSLFWACFKIEINALNNELGLLPDDDLEGSFIYWEVEQKCRKYAKAAAIFVIMHPSAIMPTFLYSIYCVAIGSFDASKLFLPFHLMVPFNIQSIWGWYLLCMIQYNLGMVYIFCMVSIISYFVCCCFYIDASCEYFGHLIRSMDGLISRTHKTKDMWKLLKMYRKATGKIKKAVELHVNILTYVSTSASLFYFRIIICIFCSLFRTLSDINNGSIFSLLFPTAVFTAMAFYHLEHVNWHSFITLRQSMQDIFSLLSQVG